MILHFSSSSSISLQLHESGTLPLQSSELNRPQHWSCKTWDKNPSLLYCHLCCNTLLVHRQLQKSIILQSRSNNSGEFPLLITDVLCKVITLYKWVTKCSHITTEMINHKKITQNSKWHTSLLIKLGGTQGDVPGLSLNNCWTYFVQQNNLCPFIVC